MTARTTSSRGTRIFAPGSADHVPLLHNCGPGPRSVYRTGGVGYRYTIAPARLVQQSFTAIGMTKLPASLFAPDTGMHLHPAVVTASLQATLERMARIAPFTAPVRDDELFERLRAGRRALGAPRTRWIERALGLLDEVRIALRVMGEGTRFHGVARWHGMDMHEEMTVIDSSDTGTIPDPHQMGVAMSVLGWASPPLVSLRRAPSLEYFRTHGLLAYRHFGPFVAS